MTGKTTTRADLTDAVYKTLGVSRNESSHFVERILEEVSAALEKGGKRQNFVVRHFLCS